MRKRLTANHFTMPYPANMLEIDIFIKGEERLYLVNIDLSIFQLMPCRFYISLTPHRELVNIE